MTFPTRIAQWDFEDALVDVVNGHTLVETGASAALAYVTGKTGAGPRAYRASHTTSFIQLTAPAANDLAKWFTVGKVNCIAFWFRPTATTLLYDFHVQTYQNNAADSIYNQVRIASVTGSGASTANVLVYGPGTATGSTVVGTRAVIGTTWHHVMVLWSGTNWWRYFDGALIASGTGAVTSNNDGGITPELRIGVTTNTRNQYYVDQLILSVYDSNHAALAAYLWNNGIGRSDVDLGWSVSAAPVLDSLTANPADITVNFTAPLTNEKHRLDLTPINGSASFTITGPNNASSVDDSTDDSQIIDAIEDAYGAATCTITNNGNGTFDIELDGTYSNSSFDFATITNRIGGDADPVITRLNTGVPAITSYSIQRGLAADTLAEIDTTASSPYVDATAVPGVTYFYAVKATNIVGSSSASSALSAMVPVPVTESTSSGIGCGLGLGL